MKAYEELASRGRAPEDFLNPPILPPMAEYWLQAFWDLSTCRQVGFGVGPIPVTAVFEYADRSRLDDDNAATLLEVVRALDEDYVAHAQRQSQAKRSEKK